MTVSPIKQYESMPTLSELQTNLDSDYNAGASRIHILPSGTLAIDSDLYIRAATVIGQGYPGFWAGTTRKGTTLDLADDVSIKMGSYGRLKNVLVDHSTDATKNAIYSDTNCNWVQLRDIAITGGNPNVWALNPVNPYEWYVENIMIRTHGNGLDLGWHDDNSNTGDMSFNELHIYLYDADTTGVRAICDTPARYINNILFNDLIISGGFNPTWESDNVNGIDLRNIKRFVFVKPNFEEVSTGIKLIGHQYGSSVTTAGIMFWGGMIHKDIEVDEGVMDTTFVNTQIEGEISDPYNVATYLHCHLHNDNFSGYIDTYLATPYYKGVNKLSATQQSANTSIYGLVGSAADLTLDNTTAYMGSGCAKAVCNRETIGGFSISTPTYIGDTSHGGMVSCIPDKMHSFSVYGKASKVGPGQVGVTWYDSSGTFISDYSAVQSVNIYAGFNYFSATGKSPANAAYCVPLLKFDNGISGDVLWWDEAWLIQID